MLAKTLKVALVLLLIIIPWSIISQSFDGDLGWHLRFGYEAWQGKFPYTDTYTWASFGLPWTNHEWGGDILYWLLYSHFSYYSLVILMTATIAGAFYLAARLPTGRTTVFSLVAAVIAIKAAGHITVMRLSMIPPLLFVFLIYSLENVTKKKWLYFWPILIWVWAALHGSWILAFIVINIYFFANIGQTILHRFFTWFSASDWTMRDYAKVLGFELLSGLAIWINPYGTKIYTEVLGYFSNNFYKSHITEWVPSYTFPIYWGSLIIGAITLCLTLILFWKKKVTVPQLLLVLAIFCSAWLYKRNALFLLLLSVPILGSVLNYAGGEISKLAIWKDSALTKRIVYGFAAATVFMMLIMFGSRIRIYSDIWSQTTNIRNALLPYQGIRYLQQAIGEKPVRIFNEFNWGGYMNWTLQSALVFFDGRGTATWRDPDNPAKTMLQKYYAIRYEPYGLEYINHSKAEYIILRNDYVSPYSRPDKLDRLFFKKSDFDKIFSVTTTPLVRDIELSPLWKKVYSDGLADIWQRISP